MLSVPWYSRVKSAPSLDAKKHHQSQQWTTEWKVKSHLYFLDILKSVVAGGMDLRVLRELTDSTAKSLFHLWKVMEIRASPNDWKSTNIYPSPEEKIWETTDRLVSSQFLNTLWNGPSWKLLPWSRKTTRWLGRANMDLPVVNPWPTNCHLWWNNLLSGWGQSSGCHLTSF